MPISAAGRTAASAALAARAPSAAVATAELTPYWEPAGLPAAIVPSSATSTHWHRVRVRVAFTTLHPKGILLPAAST